MKQYRRTTLLEDGERATATVQACGGLPKGDPYDYATQRPHRGSTNGTTCSARTSCASATTIHPNPESGAGCPPKYPTSYASRLPNEQAQETPEFCPAPRVWLDELDPESLSWCVCASWLFVQRRYWPIVS